MSLNKRASGNPVSKPCDLPKEIGTSFHRPFCKLIIAHLIGDLTKGQPSFKLAHNRLNCVEQSILVNRSAGSYYALFGGISLFMELA